MTSKSSAPAGELSLRGLFLGVLITFVFTAANIYLGLKVALTFATSIPAAVISMGVLSVFRNTSVLENNIVQTVASSAGTLSSIIFVLPGLVILGWWHVFPFWQSFALCVAGGTLGVLFTIPLRRTLVTHSDLPYPEGVAAAEVLIVGSENRDGADAETREGLWAIIYGAIASAGLAALIATRVAAAEVLGYFRFGQSTDTGYDFGFSLALVGVGHLVGLSVGMAFVVGLALAWGVLVPFLTGIDPANGLSAIDHATAIWAHQVRFIGAGAIAIAAVWSLAKLAKPLALGLATTFAGAIKDATAAGDMRDRDLSTRTVVGLTVFCLALASVLVYSFAAPTALAHNAMALTLASLPFIVIVGFFVAAICGYMAGLIGSSNSPISGVGILAILICAGGLAVGVNPSPAVSPALTAFAIFVTSIVFAVATISNDNLQDLKTGQLVGAAPWRQQVALIVGVVAGAVVIPPVLNLLAQADGFAGAIGGLAHAHPLPAPQANLIAALARGVIEHNLDWQMLGTGVALGVAIIVLDEVLGLMGWLRLPPLAVGISIYLPMSATLPVVVGAVIGDLFNRRAARSADPKRSERLGVLTASGMIVGESLFGVFFAGLIVATNNDAPLALVPENFGPAGAIGVVAFLSLTALLYGWMVRAGRLRAD